ncbi:MAG: hypothetical protein Q7J64_00800 [Elusimicrobiota bacterium]|nr:hypothetical protein [Elusimicrobiota bacterium]
MPLCPNCRHEVSRHSASNECGEPGCSCIFDPQSTAAFERTAVTPAPSIIQADRPRFPAEGAVWWPLLVVREHPYFALVLLSFSVMAVYFGIEELEDWAPTADWIAGHPSLVAWVKNVLCLLSIPGLIVLWLSSPGTKARTSNKPGPRWVLALIVGLFIAFLLYYALEIFLAGR